MKKGNWIPLRGSCERRKTGLITVYHINLMASVGHCHYWTVYCTALSGKHCRKLYLANPAPSSLDVVSQLRACPRAQVGKQRKSLFFHPPPLRKSERWPSTRLPEKSLWMSCHTHAKLLYNDYGLVGSRLMIRIRVAPKSILLAIAILLSGDRCCCSKLLHLC